MAQELNLTEVLDTALGTGQDAGKVNFGLLKVVLGTVLEKLDLGSCSAKIDDFPTSGDSPPQANENLKEKIDQLEKALEELTRPPSPNTLVDQSQRGEDAIKNDWEQKKLKKRVDQNEEGVNRALDVLDNLAQQIKNLKDEVDEHKKKTQSEQDAQDTAIENAESLANSLNERLSKMEAQDEANNQVLENLKNDLDELNKLFEDHEKRLEKCVNWDQLENSFTKDFFNENEDASSTEEQRKEFPNYFKGIQTISDYGQKIDDLLKQMENSSDSIDNLKKKSDQNENSIAENASTAKAHTEQIDAMDDQLKRILDENSRLRRDLEQYKAATDRVGDENALSQNEAMKLHDEISTLAESCLDLKKRVKNVEKISAENQEKITAQNETIGSHAEKIENHDSTLETHSDQIKELLTLKSDLEKIQNDILNNSKELNKLQQPGDVDPAALKNMQEALSGTEEELSRLGDLINQLSSDGNQKNKELEELQKLLRDLQDRAAMRDFVKDNLEKKADASELSGLLSKDDLDATAQAIINQLEDLINKQAESEADLLKSIKNIDDQVGARTKNDEFNPFRDEIEQRLRALRKKIEAAKREDLNDLSTPAGAAGFRKQLYNCISCDKNIAMRISKPILPEPSAFPARISLRPHTSYNLESTRKDVAAAHDGKVFVDPLRREGSINYSTKVVEKELERRKKMKENRLRQEINTHSFKSGTMPRQAGGAAYYVDRELRDYEIANSMRPLEPADLEGTDGQLYKGRVIRKLPEIQRPLSPDEPLKRTISPQNVAAHIPHTEAVRD